MDFHSGNSDLIASKIQVMPGRASDQNGHLYNYKMEKLLNSMSYFEYKQVTWPMV